MEYLLVHHGGRGQNYVYELTWRGQATTWRGRGGRVAGRWRPLPKSLKPA